MVIQRSCVRVGEAVERGSPGVEPVTSSNSSSIIFFDEDGSPGLPWFGSDGTIKNRTNGSAIMGRLGNNGTVRQ